MGLESLNLSRSAPLAASWTVVPALSDQATAIRCPLALIANLIGWLDPCVIGARVVGMPCVSVNTTPRSRVPKAMP